MDFTILADESTDDGDLSQLAIFVRIIGRDHRLIEYFLVITRIIISKTAAAIMDVISNFDFKSNTTFLLIYNSVVWMELIPWVVNVAVCIVWSNILHRMLSISIAVITGFHCPLFIYFKNFLHSYHLMLYSFLYGSCLSAVPSTKKFSTICNVFVS